MNIPVYLGEIQIFTGNFAPEGFAFCDGRLLQIGEYKELYALLGVTYGGDGRTTFGLPDLRGRLPIHFGATYRIGEAGGVEQVSLTKQQIPRHTHNARASTNAGDSESPTDNFWAKSPRSQQFKSGTITANAPMNAGTISSTGKGKSHDNMQPFLALNFIIALTGKMPERSA